MKYVAVFLSCPFFSIAAFSQEILTPQPIVTSPTRVASPVQDTSASFSVVNPAADKETASDSVAKSLRHVNSSVVTQTGGAGRQTSVAIRGGRSEHTLVMIDGIEVNDPSSPKRAFDFAQLTGINIERIEVLRGPQSALYGSDALGGVVNIVTKRGRGPLQVKGALNAGAYKTISESLEVRGGNNFFGYSLGASHLQSEGFSSANKADGNREKDGNRNQSGSVRLDFSPLESLSFTVFGRFFQSDAELDNHGGVGGDDPNYHGLYDAAFGRFQAEWTAVENTLVEKFSFSESFHRRRDQNPTDRDHPTDMARSKFIGKLTKVEFQQDYYLTLSSVFSFGLDLETEKASSHYDSMSGGLPFSEKFSEKSATTRGILTQYKLGKHYGLFGAVSGRYDHHDRFGQVLTYRLAPAYRFAYADTVLKASAATGFKSPSLYQLYSSYGSDELDPERLFGFDFGIEQPLFDAMVVPSVMLFKNRFSDLIDFDLATSKYENIKKAEARGVEFRVEMTVSDQIKADLSYTYTEAKDLSNHRALLKTPKHKGGFSLGYERDLFEVKSKLTFVGKRDDVDDAVGKTVSLPAYYIVDLNGAYHTGTHLDVTLRVENLLDKDYEETPGYGTAARSYYGGIRMWL